MLVKSELRPSTEITPVRAWGPLSILEEVDRLLSEAMGELMRPAQAAPYVAPADLYETDDALVLEMWVPGLAPEDIEITVEGNTLTVRGEVKPVADDKVRRYYLQEIPQGSFVRSFTLPVEVDADKAKAEFKNGVLKLTLPKVETARAKRIPVEVAE